MDKNPIEFATKITIAAIESGKITADADETAAFFEKMCDVISRCQKLWRESLDPAVTIIEADRTAQ